MLLSYRNHRIHHSILPDLRHARHAKPAGPGSHRGPVNLRNHHELMLDQYDRSIETESNIDRSRRRGIPGFVIEDIDILDLSPRALQNAAS